MVMNDTDKFDRHFEKTRERIEKTARFGLIIGLVSTLVGLGILGFIGWVIVKVMQANGVL